MFVKLGIGIIPVLKGLSLTASSVSWIIWNRTYKIITAEQLIAFANGGGDIADNPAY